jgi:hypothetical protein
MIEKRAKLQKKFLTDSALHSIWIIAFATMPARSLSPVYL